MKRFALIAAFGYAAAAVSEPAMAGGLDLMPHQTSHLCQTFGNTEICDSQPQNEVGWLSVFNIEHHRSKKLGKMVADDQCDDARRYALEKGDFRLIHNATALCAGANAKKVAAAVADLPTLSAGMTPYQQGKAQARIAMAQAEAEMGK